MEEAEEKEGSFQGKKGLCAEGEKIKKTSFKYKANNRYMYWFEICEKEKVLAPITFSKQWRGSVWY